MAREFVAKGFWSIGIGFTVKNLSLHDTHCPCSKHTRSSDVVGPLL